MKKVIGLTVLCFTFALVFVPSNTFAATACVRQVGTDSQGNANVDPGIDASLRQATKVVVGAMQDAIDLGHVNLEFKREPCEEETICCFDFLDTVPGNPMWTIRQRLLIIEQELTNKY